MTPKQLAEEAANKAWGEPQNGLASKGKMQDAVTAALSTFAEAQAKEFRRLAADLGEQANNSPAPFWQKRWRGRAEGLEQAAQMLEEKLS